MEISKPTQQEFESLFGKSGFSGFEKESMFNSEEEVKTDEKTEEEPKEEEPKEKEPKENTSKDKDDSLFTDIPSEKQTFLVQDYFAERIKEGKFLPLEDGKIESPEDFDALIDLNFKHRIDTIKDNITKSWYEEQTPAWKFIASKAESIKDPAELIPIIQGVKNIDNLSKLDVEKPEDAEQIVRIALLRRRESPELIEEQIETFKNTDKLTDLAKKYQPILIEEENQKMAEYEKQKQVEEYNNLLRIKDIHDKAIETLESPFLGKHRLKNDEKAAIYELIAEPDEDNGYKIFYEIDNLYAKGDFETLREIAMILANKDAHRTYLGVHLNTESNEKLMRTLKTTATGSTTQPVEIPTESVKRPTKTLGSGFGFFEK